MQEPSKEREWHGTVRRSCGPADGPALQFALDTLPYAACTTSHKGQANIYTSAWSYDSLQAGKVLELDGDAFCADCGRYGWDHFRLEVLSADSSGILARFTAEAKAPYVSPAPVTGTVRLKACGEKPLPFCG
jgi:hypothetical protein